MNAPAPLIRVVDDDASFRKAVARMLRASGFAVKTFASAAEYLAAPDAITTKLGVFSVAELTRLWMEAGPTFPKGQ